MDVYEVVKKLIGEIEPVGDTRIDEERFENLKITIELIDKLHTDIDNIAYYNKDKQEYSVKRAVKFINEFLTRIGISEE